MSKLPKCDPEIYEHGKHVYTLADLPAKEIEEWVRLIASKSGQRVDWHFVGGRACIRMIGDVQKVINTVGKNLPSTKYF